MTVLWVLAILVVAAVLAGWLVVSRRRFEQRQLGFETKVDSFRRHMDALSPEARRGVIDRVREAQERAARAGE